jgi:hypothetical protein
MKRKTPSYASVLRVKRKQMQGTLEWISQLALMSVTAWGLRTPIALSPASARMARCPAKSADGSACLSHDVVDE